MKLRVVNGACASAAPWHGTMALAGADDAAAPWVLLNLSGPVGSRLECDPALAGMAAASGGQPQAVLLTDAQIDQVAGLIGLRGGAMIDLYATPSVFEDLTSTMPVLPELERHCGVHWHLVPVAGDQRVAGFRVRGQDALEFTAFDTGRAPAGCVGDPQASRTGHNIAVGVLDRHSGGRAVFARGLGAMALAEPGVLDGADCLVVDPGERLSARSSTELLQWMAALPVARKVLLGSRRRGLARYGIEAGLDGLEIVV